MLITNVEWVRDHQHRMVLQLTIDGQAAHFVSKQELRLLNRGIVKGIDYLTSERQNQIPNRFIRGQFEPGLRSAELVGCTDDPRVLALFGEMCQAIAAGSWRPGRRALPAETGE